MDLRGTSQRQVDQLEGGGSQPREIEVGGDRVMETGQAQGCKRSIVRTIFNHS